MAKPKGQKIGGQFVPLLYDMLDGAAWRALRPEARLAYIAVKRRARPEINGKIFASVRDVAGEVGIGVNRASAALRELQAKGLLRAVQVGRLGIEGKGRATTWHLTELGSPADPRPTKDYLRWRPDAEFPVAMGGKIDTRKNRIPSRRQRQSCPGVGDVSSEPVPASEMSCHGVGDVQGTFPPEPVPASETHLDLAREGTVGGEPRSFVVVRGGQPVRWGVRAVRGVA